jgi:hypothetical protein
MVANRQRDWGEATSISTFRYKEGFHRGTYGLAYPRRLQKTPEYRASVDVAGNRILLAIPGYGCCFQIPVIVPISDTATGGIGTLKPFNSIYDRPRCLGVPKAATLAIIGSGGLVGAVPLGNLGLPQGVYRVNVVYKDEGTGEVGLPSEDIYFTVSGTTNQTLYLLTMHPGYLMAESLALTLQVYITQHNDTAMGFYEAAQIPKFGNPTAIANAGVNLLFLHRLTTAPTGTGTNYADEIDYTVQPLAFAQMPMGAKAIRTIRGVTFFGGHLGDIGLRKELAHGTASSRASAQDDANRDDIYIIPMQQHRRPMDTAFNVAQAIIPPAYGGVELFSDDLYPAPHKDVFLDKQLNCRASLDVQGNPTIPHKWAQRFSLVHPVQQSYSTGGVEQADVYLKLPRGQYSFSEVGHPGYVPSSNRGYLDQDKVEDVEAIGRFQNFAVLCTISQTFRVQWGENPLNQTPQIINNEFGCIAPNSMTEFDGGLFWLSSRGPVILTSGGIDWIGQQLEEYFVGDTAKYAVDSEGKALYAWGCHDPERSLVYLGLRTKDEATVGPDSETFDSSNDGQKSKFPCDEILVWNYRRNAFSVWEAPTGLFIYWMRRLLCADGIYRVCFLAEDFRIYAMDDGWSDSYTTPVSTTALSAGVATTTFTGQAGAFDGNYVRIGMHYTLYDGDDKLIGYGQLSSVAAASDQVTLDQSLTWSAGDTLEIGVLPPLTIETNSETYIPGRRPSKVTGLDLRYSSFTDGKAWTNAKAKSNRGTAEYSVFSGTKTNVYSPLQASTDKERVLETRLARGEVMGADLSFVMEVVGTGQTRMSDIEAEVKKS